MTSSSLQKRKSEQDLAELQQNEENETIEEIPPESNLMEENEETRHIPHLTIDTSTINESNKSYTPKGKSSQANGRTMVGRWTQEEHALFLEGLRKYGKSWKKIAQLIRTRTLVQIRTHAQKYLQKQKWAGNESPTMMTARSPTSVPMGIGCHPMLHPSGFLMSEGANDAFFHGASMQWDQMNSQFDNFDLSDHETDPKDDTESTDSRSEDEKVLDFPDALPLGSELDDILSADDSLDWLADCVSNDFDCLLPGSPSKNDCIIRPNPPPKPCTPKRRKLQPSTHKHLGGPLVPIHGLDFNPYMWAPSFVPFPLMAGRM